MNKDVYVSPNVWKIYTVSYMHYSTIGFLVGMAVGLAVSLLFPTDQCVDPKLLAPWLRKSTHSKFVTDAPQFNGTREMTPYQPVSQNTTELWRCSKPVFKSIENTGGRFSGAWQWLFINFILYFLRLLHSPITLKKLWFWIVHPIICHWCVILRKRSKNNFFNVNCIIYL